MAKKIAHLPSDELSAKGFRTVRTSYFSVKVKRNGGQYARIGVIAGKAAAGTAVGRNFLKRQARSLISKVIMPGNDILVVFSPAVRTLTKRRLGEELRAAAGKSQS